MTTRAKLPTPPKGVRYVVDIYKMIDTLKEGPVKKALERFAGKCQPGSNGGTVGFYIDDSDDPDHVLISTLLVETGFKKGEGVLILVSW